MAANNNIPITSTGPALGNVPTPDSYLRLKLNIDGLKAQIAALQASGSQSASFTAQQLQQLQKALQANGSNPLNLTALAGQTLQPQQALIPSVLTLASSGTDGQVVFYRNAVWRFSSSTHRWTPISTTIILDYEYNLSAYNPAKYAPGSLFISINTNVSFIEEDTSSGSKWVPLYSETAAYPHADRFSTGIVNTVGGNTSSNVSWNNGTIFRPEMLGQQIWIESVLYPITSYTSNTSITVAGNTGNQNNANYAFEFPSINYPRGALFYETDRTVFYYCADASGALTVTGNNLSGPNGQPFDRYWTSIQINNNNYPISVQSASAATLLSPGPANGIQGYFVERGAWFYASGVMTAAGNGNFPQDLNINTDAGFYVWDSNRTIMRQAINVAANLSWVYQWGIYKDLLANIPGPLHANDVGLLFYATDVEHSFEAVVSGNNFVWNFAPGDPGSGYIVAGTQAPNGGLWALCDGNNANVTLGSGNLTTVTTPNLSAGVFLRGANNGSNSVGVVNSATAATWAVGAKTDDEAAHTHTINVTSNNAVLLNAGNNTVVTAVASPTSSGTAHNHNLSNNNAVLNAPSDANGGLPLNVELLWYMRR